MLSHSIAESYGAKAVVEWDDGYPVVVNHEKETENIFRAAKKAQITAVLIPAIMASEDFGYYLQKVPGSVFFLGGGLTGPHRTSNHSPTFDFNDDVLPIAVTMWIRLIEDRIGVSLYL